MAGCDQCRADQAFQQSCADAAKNFLAVMRFIGSARDGNGVLDMAVAHFRNGAGLADDFIAEAQGIRHGGEEIVDRAEVLFLRRIEEFLVQSVRIRFRQCRVEPDFTAVICQAFHLRLHVAVVLFARLVKFAHLCLHRTGVGAEVRLRLVDRGRGEIQRRLFAQDVARHVFDFGLRGCRRIVIADGGNCGMIRFKAAIGRDTGRECKAACKDCRRGMRCDAVENALDGFGGHENSPRARQGPSIRIFRIKSIISCRSWHVS